MQQCNILCSVRVPWASSGGAGWGSRTAETIPLPCGGGTHRHIPTFLNNETSLGGLRDLRRELVHMTTPLPGQRVLSYKRVGIVDDGN